MSRSVHDTWGMLAEVRRADFADEDARADRIADLKANLRRQHFFRTSARRLRKALIATLRSMNTRAQLLVAAVITAACGPPPAPSAAMNAEVDQGLPAPTTSAAPLDTRAPEPAERAPFVTGNNAFAASLWGVIRSRPGNLSVSPASITTAMAMAFFGARGETAAEIARALHFEASPEDTMRAAGELVQGWSTAGGPTVLRAANRLFVDKTVPLERPFLDAAERTFGAPFEAVDFTKSADRAREQINDWVLVQTHYHVRDLLPRASLDGQTRLVLVNALYFKADWASPFDPSSTRPLAFHVNSTTTKEAPMMNKVATFRFAAPPGLRILEMPYQGDDASMVFLLPDAADGLPALEQTLTGADIDRWMDVAKPARVAVTLPRFEIDPASSLSLRDTLGALGIRLAFDKKTADFTGISSPKDPRDRLFLKEVFHKAFVRLDEKGTEAAAATAELSARGAVEPEPEVFRADHPFLFVLRDTKTGMILFWGRVADPSSP